MDKKVRADLYRLYGSKKNILRAMSDFRFLYMFCWRNIVSGSKLTVIYKLILKHLRKHYHIEIPYTVSLGSGFSMDHAYNITINSKAVIGNNVTMYKGSTIGMDKSGVPTIGNNVYIGLNTTIVGGVSIGNDVLVAPNTYINFDVPDHSIVIGNPGTIHKKNIATEGYLLNVVEIMENENEKKFN